ncbi:uncharacterized protein LOC144582522 isoform X4 [Callithrix jacchus]
MHAGAGVVRARARWTRKRHSEPEVEVVCRLPGGFSVASTAPELSASYSPRSSARTRQPRPLPSAGRCRPFPRGMGCGAWRSSSGISATEEESCSGTQCSSAITVHSTSPAQVILPPQSPKTPGLFPTDGEAKTGLGASFKGSDSQKLITARSARSSSKPSPMPQQMGSPEITFHQEPRILSLLI